jgi:hypothetical protein
LEEQVRAEIIKRHEDAKQKTKAKATKEVTVDLSGAVGLETIGVVHEEDCDSVAEEERFKTLCDDKKLYNDPVTHPEDSEEEKKEEEGGSKGGKGKKNSGVEAIQEGEEAGDS